MRILLLAALAGCANGAGAPPSAGALPNLVWIWADNLGWGDLACYGNARVKTPVIDRLAAEGARFTQFYVAHTVCSPSRAALLTGRQPFRCGIVDVLRPDSPSGLPREEVTIAEALRERGYVTAAFGKWHLGDRREFLPLRHGFDRWFGLPYSMDMLPTLLYRDDAIADTLDGDRVQDVTERMTREAVRFVEERRGGPFFIYFSHTIPHPPLNLPARCRTPGRPIYEDALEHLDEQVGVLLATLERLGLARDTLVIFSSDNGPMDQGGSAGGLRGRIREATEGGVRVPFLARWPGRIPGGRVVDVPAIATDVFPTLIRLAGGRPPDDRGYDGQDIWPLMTGQGEFRREKPFVWVDLDQVLAVREGRWKLHLAARNKPLPEPELYDVESDPKESRKLNALHPEALKRLSDLAAEAQAEVPKVWTLQYPVRDPDKFKGGIRRN